MLCVALGENLRFYQHIFKSCMAFRKLIIFCNVAVKYFSRCPNLRCFVGGQVAVCLAKLDVGFLLANGTFCHFHSAVPNCFVGEEVTAF